MAFCCKLGTWHAINHQVNVTRGQRGNISVKWWIIWKSLWTADRLSAVSGNHQHHTVQCSLCCHWVVSSQLGIVRRTDSISRLIPFRSVDPLHPAGWYRTPADGLSGRAAGNCRADVKQSLPVLARSGSDWRTDTTSYRGNERPTDRPRSAGTRGEVHQHLPPCSLRRCLRSALTRDL